MRTLLVVATAVLALTAVGPTLAGTSQSRETWGKKADRICARIDAEIDELVPPDDLAGFATQLPKLLALGKKEYRQVSALARPAPQRKKINVYLATYPKLFALIEQMIPAAKAGDGRAFGRLLEKGNPISAAAKKLGIALGAPACGN